MDTTAHDLKILSLCYYIQAGLVSFYSLLMLGYAAFIGVMFSAIQTSAQTSGKEIPPWFGALMAGIFAAIFLIMICLALCQFLTGRWLNQHKHKLFCQIVAGFGCLLIPYGTALSVFTFLVLGRPAARSLFAGAEIQPPPPSPSIDSGV